MDSVIYTAMLCHRQVFVHDVTIQVGRNHDLGPERTTYRHGRRVTSPPSPSRAHTRWFSLSRSLDTGRARQGADRGSADDIGMNALPGQCVDRADVRPATG